MSERSFNENSILFTVKQMLGLDEDYEVFDTDVITHINTALMTLQQLGVGPESGMFITGLNQTWDDFFSSEQMLEAAKTYVYIRVRMVFDPPTNSFVMDSLQKTSDMLEWRLKEQARFFDGSKGKYIKRTPEGSSDVAEDDKVTGFTIVDGTLMLVEENATSGALSGVVHTDGYLGSAVHIDNDGITPIDDEIGRNVYFGRDE